MGMCGYGLQWVVVPNLPQVEEIAEIAKEEEDDIGELYWYVGFNVYVSFSRFGLFVPVLCFPSLILLQY